MPAKKRRFWKLLAWSFLLLTTSVIGGLWYAYSYATDSATIAQIVREHAPEYLPGCMVEVGKSHLKLLTGGITLNHVSVRQPMDGSTFQTLYLPWLHIDYDARASAEGRVVPLAIAVTHPILRLRQQLQKKSFSKQYTRAELNANQEEYWHKRLARQANQDLLSCGRVGVGNRSVPGARKGELDRDAGKPGLKSFGGAVGASH